MLVTVKDDILEMNVKSRMRYTGQSEWSCTVRRGGHIQSIVGTECSTRQEASKVLVDLAANLTSGKWELGTVSGKPCAKRVEAFTPQKLNKRPLVA